MYFQCNLFIYRFYFPECQIILRTFQRYRIRTGHKIVGKIHNTNVGAPGNREINFLTFTARKIGAVMAMF